MQRFFADYLKRLEELHADIEQAIEGLSDDALDWVPGRNMNSIGILVVHVAGAERYWIGDVVARESSARDREAEFGVQGLGATTLKERLANALAYVRGVLEELSVEQLEEVRISPRNERQSTVGWSLVHALAHTAIHVGHMQLARQLWDQRQDTG